MANRPQAKLKFYEGYGENFKKLREEAGLTLAELGKQINYSDKAISMIETEGRQPTIEQLNIYSEKFNVSLDYLTGRTTAARADIQMICEYTGLSVKAVKEVIKLNRRNNVSAYGSGIAEIYQFINALNFLLESENFYYFIQPLSCVFRYCKPSYIIDDDKVKSNGFYDMNEDELNRFCSKMEAYCMESNSEIVSKSELAELKLSYAQNALMGIFQELIDQSFGTDE